MKTERVQTDVLCIGGGIAGLMAAIRASESGAKVVVAEKGATKYSGSARAGNDHFWCYIPEILGPDVDLIIRESRITQKGPLMAMLGTTFLRFHARSSWAWSASSTHSTEGASSGSHTS